MVYAFNNADLMQLQLDLRRLNETLFSPVIIIKSKTLFYLKQLSVHVTFH